MAKKVEVEKLVYSGGEESHLSYLGGFFIILGVTGLAVCFIISGYVTGTPTSTGWAENGLSPLWITIGVVGLIQGIALCVILNAGAEVIRLLKKLNGLKFSGEISEPEVETQIELQCSKCGNNDIYEVSTKCSKCGEEFESTTE